MKRLFVIALFAFCAAGVSAQHMFDYSDIKAGKFRQKSIGGLRSMKDGEHYTAVSEGRIEKFAYRTGEKTAVLFDISNFPETGGAMVTYVFSPDESQILIATDYNPIYRRSYTANYWIYNITAGTLRRLTVEGGEQVPSFSPDGSRVAFVRGNNIYCTRTGGTAPQEVMTVTDDGAHGTIINGHTDWVYEEEFGFTQAFEWSPDGAKIAYMRFDETLVPEVTITKFNDGLYPSVMKFKYPKAGEVNSVVSLHVYDLAKGSSAGVDTGSETDQYISRIGWTPAGELFFYRVNRLQNRFEVLVAGASGAPRTVYEENDKRYIERPDAETVTFLPKGDRFVVKNETSGYTHLYLYDMKKGLTDTLTRGNWEVRRLVGVEGDRAYYVSNEGSPLRNALYSVRLNGKGKTRLTEEEGTFSIIPSSNFKYFISFFSSVATPNLVRLHDGTGKVVRVLEDNADLRTAIDKYNVPRKEFFTFKTGRGTVLNGYMIKPRNFDPTKKYPVMMTQYSGPGSQQVTDAWSMDWTDVLVQEGYVVVCVDGRGTGGRGADFKKVTYGNLGGPETEDQIAAGKYVASQPWADLTRIGIYGWSYGGFMALNCILKGNDVFKTAIAVAPVTSWRFYDTIYTEIYNGLPQDNPGGYDDNSPVNFAANLKGRLLMIHGSADDNVHPQNTFRMAEALVREGKQFDMMIYPDDNHSMFPTGRHHIMEKMISYTLSNL